MADIKARKRRLASYIGAGAADPIGWTQVAPVAPPPGGKVYITDGGTPLRYRIDGAGNYLTKDA